MNALPPLRLLEQWRTAGLSPEQIYQKCKEAARLRGVVERQPRDDSDMANCEACQNNPKAKGLCHKHYNRLWMRAKREASGAEDKILTDSGLLSSLISEAKLNRSDSPDWRQELEDL